MSPTVRLDSTVSLGKSTSGSVSSTFWSTSCSSTARRAKTRPRSSTSSREGLLDLVVQAGEELRNCHDTTAVDELVATAGEVAVHRGPRQPASRAASSTVVLDSPQRATQA